MNHSKCRAILYSGDIEANSKDLYKCHAILFFLLLLKQADTQMRGNGKPGTMATFLTRQTVSVAVSQTKYKKKTYLLCKASIHSALLTDQSLESICMSCYLEGRNCQERNLWKWCKKSLCTCAQTSTLLSLSKNM